MEGKGLNYNLYMNHPRHLVSSGPLDRLKGISLMLCVCVCVCVCWGGGGGA